MPPQNKQREIKILRAAKEQGKSDEFIANVIRIDRERNAQKTEVEQPAVPGQGGDFLGKAAGALDTVFGGGKIGEAIGTQIAKLGPDAQRLKKFEQQGVLPQGTSEEAFQGPSVGELAGSAARAALLFTPIGKGAQLAGAGAKALGAGAKAINLARGAGAVGAGATTGAAFDTAGGVERGETIGEAIKPGAGALVGGALPIVGNIGKGIAQTLASSLPNRLVTSALKLTPKGAGSTGGKKAVARILEGRAGTAKGLLSEANTNVGTLSKDISSGLKESPKTTVVRKNEVVDRIKADDFFADAGFTSKEIIEEVTRLVPRARLLLRRKELNLEDANRLRQIIDQTLGDRFFTMQNPAANKEILNAFSRNLSELIKQRGPKGTRVLFDELTKEISLRNALNDRVTKGAGNQIISLGDLVVGGVGTAVGGGAGTLGAIVARRAIQSTPALTGAAQVSKKIGEAIQAIPDLESAPSKLLLNLLERARTNL